MDRLCRQPKAPSVLHRAQPAKLLLRPPLVVVPEVGVEHAAELGDGHPGPAPVVEELILEPSKEPLHRRVVGRTSLLRHRPDQVAPLADLDPSRPSVMASAVGVRHGALAFGKRPARRLQAVVRELRVGPRCLSHT